MRAYDRRSGAALLSQQVIEEVDRIQRTIESIEHRIGEVEESERFATMLLLGRARQDRGCVTDSLRRSGTIHA